MRRLALRYQSALLRFSRWNRSRAAAFRSLGRVVSIRSLAVGVIRLLERKTMNLNKIDAFTLVNNLIVSDDREEECLWKDWVAQLFTQLSQYSPAGSAVFIGNS